MACILLDAKIKAQEVSALRGAIIEHVGKDPENILFHQHTEEGASVYQYPLIQYKRMNERPMIVGIEYGADEIFRIFLQKNKELNILGNKIPIQVHKYFLRNHKLGIWQNTFHYRITNWLAFNQKNVGLWNQCQTEEEKRKLLKKLLIGNILSLAKGLDWFVKDAVEVEITKTPDVFVQQVKKQKMLSLNVSFQSNVSLPNWISIGKLASLGHGMIWNQVLEKEESELISAGTSVSTIQENF